MPIRRRDGRAAADDQVRLIRLILILIRGDLICRCILEMPVTEREFLEQLHELQHKISFVKEQSFREAKACNDVVKVLEELKIKVR